MVCKYYIDHYPAVGSICNNQDSKSMGCVIKDVKYHECCKYYKTKDVVYTNVIITNLWRNRVESNYTIKVKCTDKDNRLFTMVFNVDTLTKLDMKYDFAIVYDNSIELMSNGMLKVNMIRGKFA